MRRRVLNSFLVALSSFSASAFPTFTSPVTKATAVGLGSLSRAAWIRTAGTKMSLTGGVPSPGDTLVFDHPLQTRPACTTEWSPPDSAGPVKIILGSKSSTRKLLLSSMGVKYDIINPEIDEKAIREEEAEKLVIALAHAKADALLSRTEVIELKQAPGITLLITSDQVVVHEGKILEKPEDAAEAKRFITGYGRSPCSTVGGYVVTNLQTGKRCESLDKASIFFKDIPQDIIDGLIQEGEVFYCAGGLMVEAPSIQPYLVKIEGSMDSVMGFGRHIASALLDQALEP